MKIYPSIEASEFWDEHDFGEFDDLKETDEVQFSLKKKKYVGIYQDLYAYIKSKAKELQEPEEALKRMACRKSRYVNCVCHQLSSSNTSINQTPPLLRQPLSDLPLDY